MKRLKDKEQEFVEGSRDRVMFEDMIDNANDNVNENVNINVNTSVNTNNNEYVVTIVKNADEEKTKLHGYHLPISMGEKIEKLAKKSNMSNSEFVRKLLSETLDKIIIEK